MLTVVPGAGDGGEPRRDGRGSAGSSVIDELVGEGARRMLAEALQAEVEDYIARFTTERDANGRRLVARKRPPPAAGGPDLGGRGRGGRPAGERASHRP